jgi:hypothetical protein
LKRILTCTAVMIAQVAATDFLYYVRINRIMSTVTMFDVVAFCLSLLVAFAVFAAACGVLDSGRAAVSRAVRLIVSLALTAFGFFVALLIGVNAWGE